MQKLTAQKAKTELKKHIDLEKAKLLPRFFKTGKGEYGEGDKFMGVTVPNIRMVAKKFQDVELSEIKKLLSSKIHEERLLALFILVNQFKKADLSKKHKLVDFYITNSKYVNNWDLVDSSAGKLIGEYLLDKDRNLLYVLAKSEDLWEKRIAIIATQAFIRKSQFSDTLKISEMLLKDPHDLMHKAVGWMLREVGKKDRKELEKFLASNYLKMPRTMLRYAIEHFAEEDRQKYLKGKI